MVVAKCIRAVKCWSPPQLSGKDSCETNHFPTISLDLDEIMHRANLQAQMTTKGA